MPRARDPNRDKAFQIWKERKGTITNRALAEMLNVPEKTISAWKSRDKWNVVLQTDECSTTKQGNSKPKRKVEKKQPEIEVFVESDDLTDKQRLFCIYYIKYYSAIKAYQRAFECSYIAAHSNAYRMMANEGIKKEIGRLKKDIADGLMLDSTAVIQKYIDIAFADITDFVEFGQEKRPELDHNLEPMIDDNGDEITYSYSYVNLKNHDEVDGTVITEVKKGKDGISLKLADKMRALEMLTKYFDILPDTEKRRLQEEKLKMELSSMRGDTEGDAHQQANSYLEALNASVDDVFDEDEGEPDGNEA